MAEVSVIIKIILAFCGFIALMILVVRGLEAIVINKKAPQKPISENRIKFEEYMDKKKEKERMEEQIKANNKDKTELPF